MLRNNAVNWLNISIYSIFLWCIINRVVMHWDWIRAVGLMTACLYTNLFLLLLMFTVGVILLRCVFQGWDPKVMAWRIRNAHMMDENFFWFLMPLLMTLAGYWQYGVLILITTGVVIIATHVTQRIAGTISQGV